MAKPIQLLAKSAKLLNTVADRGALQISELAEELDMPRPSVYRLVDALKLVGLVSVLDDGRTQLGLEVLHLAHAALELLPEVRASRDELERLNSITGQTVYVCAPRGDRIACLDWVRGTRVSLLLLSPGGTLPLHAGATSRAILAHSPAHRKEIAVGELEQFTPKTIHSADELEQDAKEIRKRGYSISDEDVTEGIAAIGVPVFGPKGELRCAISVAGFRAEVLGRETEFADQLMTSARRIEELLATSES